MEENELRHALRATMTLIPAPPPMRPTAALAAGRRAARRRTVLACAGAAAALAVGTATALPAQHIFGGQRQNPPMVPGAAPSATQTPFPAIGTLKPHPGNTGPSWPAEASGDATADSGPHYEQGKKLLGVLIAVTPDGYTIPAGSAPDGIPLRSHQATIDEPSWRYLASVAIARSGGTGRLLAEVHAVGNELPTAPCDLAQAFWGMGGTCQVQQVGGAQVGVVVRAGEDQRLDQWAAYRYRDGCVVYVAQSRNATNSQDSGLKPLADLPLSVADLAKLATDERFHLR